MSFQWLKTYMPKGLYGRAALILLLPVVMLQLGISIAFIQRHFEDVTEQMTRSVANDLNFAVLSANEADTPEAALAELERIGGPLALDFVLPDMEAEVAATRRWYDFSGIVVRREMQLRVPALVEVDLPTNRLVTVWATTDHGLLRIGFDRRRVSASNPHQLLVLMVVLGALLTLISYIYLRNQLRPITRLAAAASEYGRGRVVPYNPAGAVEVRQAGHAFLDMRARIERQAQTRTLMLSGISHDLRTPLTRLRLGLGLMDEAEAAPLIRDVDDMQHLLDAFLDYARGSAEDEPEVCDPVDLARQVLEDARRARQDVEEGEFSAGGETVPLRPMAIRRALENLIGNGLRYGTKARLSVQLSPRAVRFTVEDNGPGIPEDQREDAVRPFTRLDPARNQDRGSGVGLGLAIVADIARQHGGSLRLDQSEGLGGLRVDMVVAR